MIQLFNGDCLEAMKKMKDNEFDLAIVDPPYGRNALDGSRTARIYGINRSKNWDCYRPTKDYFNELRRVSKNQIIWGGNYFISDLIDTKCFLIWNKPSMIGMNTMSFGEMAWTSFDSPAKIYHGESDKLQRIHPTQKPVALYTWLLDKYAKPGDKILDTHLGSGSIAIACHNLGYDLVGYELDKDYFEAAKHRLEEHQKQLRLF